MYWRGRGEGAPEIVVQGNQLRRSLHREASQHRLSRTTSWKARFSLVSRVAKLQSCCTVFRIRCPPQLSREECSKLHPYFLSVVGLLLQDGGSFSGTLSSSREQKLSAELQKVRLCLGELEAQINRIGRSSDTSSREESNAILSKAAEHADAAKELAELLKKV